MYAGTMNFQDSFAEGKLKSVTKPMMIVQPRLSFNTITGEPVVKPTETLEQYEKLLIDELTNG